MYGRCTKFLQSANTRTLLWNLSSPHSLRQVFKRVPYYLIVKWYVVCTVKFKLHVIDRPLTHTSHLCYSCLRHSLESWLRTVRFSSEHGWLPDSPFPISPRVKLPPAIRPDGNAEFGPESSVVTQCRAWLHFEPFIRIKHLTSLTVKIKFDDSGIYQQPDFLPPRCVVENTWKSILTALWSRMKVALPWPPRLLTATYYFSNNSVCILRWQRVKQLHLM